MKTNPLIGPIAAAASVLIVLSAPSAATTIQFNDLTESPSALAGDRPPLQAVNTCISESGCFVSLPNFLAADNGGYRAQFALTEPPGGDEPAGTLSDVIQFSVPPNNPRELDVFLFSDPITSQVAGLTFYGTAKEIGSLQLIPLPNNLPVINGNGTLTVEAASEARVPEPATWLLMAGGLLSLVIAYAKRRPAVKS